MSIFKELLLKATVNLDGSITPIGAKKLYKFINRIANTEQEIEVLIRPLNTKRTASQNRYYWGVIVLTIMRFLEESEGRKVSKGEVHAYNLEITGYAPEFKEIKIFDSTLGDYTIKEVAVFDKKTTSQMNTKEFKEFIDKITLYWNELDVSFPEPRKDNYINDYINN